MDRFERADELKLSKLLEQIHNLFFEQTVEPFYAIGSN